MRKISKFAIIVLGLAVALGGYLFARSWNGSIRSSPVAGPRGLPTPKTHAAPVQPLE